METEPTILLALLNNIQVTIMPFKTEVIVALIVVLILLLCSALISGSEVAFFSLSPVAKKDLLRNKKDKRAANVLKNLDNPEELLATILVANNFVNIGVVILSSFVAHNTISFTQSPILEFVFQVVLITFLLLLFGEIMPKVYATHKPVAIAKLMAAPLLFLSKIFSPINRVLIFSTSFVNNRIKAKTSKNNLSIDDISQALELTSDHEISEEKDILVGIVKFGNKDVEEIMSPRVDVVALDIKTPYQEVLKVINESGFSRIPVYADSFDNIRGVLYIKDLLAHTHKNIFRWQSLIRPPFYVPESKKISSLLEEFQKSKIHMAIVVDEYGGTSGIVTLEDILEEIVGDIADEFDEEQEQYQKIDENTYLFDGKTLLGDFYKVVDCADTVFDEVKGDADTLAGIILEIKGEIPQKNDKITYDNFTFIVESVDQRRIKEIKVEINK